MSAGRQSDSEKVFPKATFLLVSVASDKLTRKFMEYI